MEAGQLPKHTIQGLSGKENLETLVGAYLAASGQRISVAESCTGGRIASRLTAVPGSSRYFESGCVTYSNASKTRLLGVPAKLIEEKGAVSREVASAMAEGTRSREGVDFALAVTGIAGPGGGSSEKPIGLVYIALADDQETDVAKYRFEGRRETIQSAATQKALEMLINKLSSVE